MSLVPPPISPQTATALLSRMEERGLAGHALRVCALTAAVTRKLGMSERASHSVALAALLHDVGKLAIPASILDKTEPLTLSEWELLRTHPVVGERILSRCAGLEGLAPLVRHSHERVDGSGYPDRLAGALIPLGSRVITVCDAWDAMTSERSYQPPVPFDEAIRRLVDDAGHQFDVDVVAASVAVLRAEGLKSELPSVDG